MVRTQYQVLSTKYGVPRLSAFHTPHSALRTLPLFLALVAGCNSSPQAAANPEPSLAQQVASVKAGDADQILIAAAPLSDSDLATIADATALRSLLIDHESSNISAAGIGHLTSLPNLEHLRLRGPGTGDDALAEITKITSLQILNIPRGEFTNAGLEHLKALPNLIQLRFGSPHVTDAGMKTLAELPSLKRLHLIDVPITDAGLRVLASIEQLESLYIDGADLSDAAYDDLFHQRPSLHVHINQQHHDRDPHQHAH